MTKEGAILQQLAESGNLRTLEHYRCTGGMVVHNEQNYVNLSSNDYLGLSERLDLQQLFLDTLPRNSFLMSNPSSRLMCGNSEDYDLLETAIAHLHHAEAALVVGSGYLLNSSILRAITTPDSVIIADKLIHASLTDGLRLAECPFERFRHNDTEHLRKLLAKHPGKHIVVVVESLYSMDGDHAPFNEIRALQSEFQFELLIDDAHAFGVFGDQGTGLIPDDLHPDYKIATLGKACASTGAFVVCTEERKRLLINRMRSVIFSTALPPINLRWSKYIIEQLPSFTAERAHLCGLIRRMDGESQIIPIPAGGNDQALKIAHSLQSNGFWATAIRHPTVPLGTERVRISLTAAHTQQQINDLCKSLGR